MKRKIVLVAMLALALTDMATAQDTPTFSPDGHGGYIVTFEARHFQNLQHGYLDGNDFVIPRDGTMRSCTFSTMTIPIPHADGCLSSEIEFEGQWIGFLNPLSPTDSDADLFKMQVNVESGGDKRTFRDFYYTGLMNKVVDYVESPSHIHVTAKTNGMVKHQLPDAYVKKDDKVTINMCDVRPGTFVKVRRVKVHTYPNTNGCS